MLILDEIVRPKIISLRRHNTGERKIRINTMTQYEAGTACSNWLGHALEFPSAHKQGPNIQLFASNSPILCHKYGETRTRLQPCRDACILKRLSLPLCIPALSNPECRAAQTSSDMSKPNSTRPVRKSQTPQTRLP